MKSTKHNFLITRISLLILGIIWFSAEIAAMGRSWKLFNSANDELSEDSLVIRSRVIESVEYLQTLFQSGCLTPIEPSVIHYDTFYQKSYRLLKSGCITFDDGVTIFLQSFSSHDDNTHLDLTIALDSNGRVFLNRGHVCGGIINFITNNKLDITGVDDFFRDYVSDTDDQPWVEYFMEANNQGNLNK